MSKYSLLCFYLLFTGCRYGNHLGFRNESESSITRDSIPSVNKPSHLKFNKDLLIGIWALAKDTNENAVFVLGRDSIFYADQEGPATFRYVIENDSFKVFQPGYLAASRIIYVDGNLFMTVGDNLDTIKYFRKTW